jgi:DNA invertase Pin-like site-specific DNA recombinase
MFTIIGSLAELESSLIGERVTAGMKAAVASTAADSRDRKASRGTLCIF